MAFDEYDVVIIGGGVSGTSLLYVLTNYTNVKKILLLEKHKDYAQVSSHHTQNSQTLHFGDIETNYSYDKAFSVKKKTDLLKNYIEKFAKGKRVFFKGSKMVIGVGDEEVKGVRERYNALKKEFKNIKLLERDEIKKYEPKVVEGRDENEKIIALYSPDGYVMNYYELSKNFIQNSRKGREIDIKLGAEVSRVNTEKEGYTINSSVGDFKARFLVCDAGSMSIKFAKQVGLGKHLTIMSLAGNFYRTPKTLNGKVYTWQHPKRPNAAIHGDADVTGGNYTRFGPTAKILLMLERRNYKTFWDYLKAFNYSLAGWESVFRVGFDPDYFFYMLENYLIEIPIIGKMILSRHIKKIVPTAKWQEIKKDKGYGATRPQIIDTRTKKVALGEARIEGPSSVFNVTPSPGASTCLANAERDALEIVKTLGLKFDQKKFDKDFRK